MRPYFELALSLWLVFGAAAVAASDEAPSLRARWEMPPRCTPFAEPRIKDLKEELRQTGYQAFADRLGQSRQDVEAVPFV